MKKTKINLLITVLLLITSLTILFPVYMMFTVALKNPQELTQSIMGLPTGFHVENFLKAMKLTHYFRSFLNSFMVTIVAVLLTLFTNSFVSYAISRNMQKKYYQFVFYYFISAMFVPFALIMLPIVKEMSTLHLSNLAGLSFLYGVYGLPLNVFIYVGYIKSLPKAMEESAFIDGANIWQVFWKVIFPLMAPINATASILTVMWAWNDFLLPLILLNGNSSQATLPLVQFVFNSQFTTNYNLAFASYILALAPLVIVYLFAQRWIIGGIAKGAVK